MRGRDGGQREGEESGRVKRGVGRREMQVREGGKEIRVGWRRKRKKRRGEMREKREKRGRREKNGGRRKEEKERRKEGKTRAKNRNKMEDNLKFLLL